MARWFSASFGGPGLADGTLICSRFVSELPIHLETPSFTADRWEGSFYPRGLKPADLLSFVADHLDMVEVDSTFYGEYKGKWICVTGTIADYRNVPQIVTHSPKQITVGEF